MDIEQLKKIEAHYQELEQLLASNEVISDNERCSRLAKELSDLKDAVILFREYKKTIKEIIDLEAMLRDQRDPQMLDLAKSEAETLKAKKEELEEKINQELSPEDKDINRNVIVEIRPGTGGAICSRSISYVYEVCAAQRLGSGADVG